jgi:hypothetical protein
MLGFELDWQVFQFVVREIHLENAKMINIHHAYLFLGRQIFVGTSGNLTINVGTILGGA